MIEVDLEDRLGYAYYIKDQDVVETIEVMGHGRVAADLNAAGDIVGIEVLALGDETLAPARAFAAAHGLAFPDLSRVRA